MTLKNCLLVIGFIVSNLCLIHAKKKPEEPSPCLTPGANCTDLQFVLSARELPMRKALLLGKDAPDTFMEIEYWDKLKSEDSRMYVTSVESGTLNPEWADVVRVSFLEGQGQRVKFTIRDVDKPGEIGHVSTSIKSIAQAQGNKIELELVGPSQRPGRLIIYTLINEQANDDTVERLTASKKKKKINLDKKPKKKNKKKENEEDAEGDDDDDHEN